LGTYLTIVLSFISTQGVFSKEFVQPLDQASRSLHKTGLVVHPYFSIVQTFLARPRSSFGLTETSSHDNIRIVLACPRSSFGLAGSSSHNDYFCNNACTGLHCHFLWANRDIFAWQHTAYLGPPKELIKVKCGTLSPPSSQPGHLCMAPYDLSCLPKEMFTPREGPRHQSLRANHDVFSSQHVNSHGPPNCILMVRKTTGEFSLAN
jgi:hypothetical protein